MATYESMLYERDGRLIIYVLDAEKHCVFAHTYYDCGMLFQKLKFLVRRDECLDKDNSEQILVQEYNHYLNNGVPIIGEHVGGTWDDKIVLYPVNMSDEVARILMSCVRRLSRIDVPRACILS
jgi:hypothetical protein